MLNLIDGGVDVDADIDVIVGFHDWVFVMLFLLVFFV